ncbi:MAG TPA: RNA polymerase sigma factor [Candidatus Brocadiia bacterium]|nr:sigma-70 family RNA polymerase sigma factor [Planctomycetota bacterium]MDO8092154.1 sigma-70 family RNA polymerase sigma factor [Candidatus Brocadiales bacterium]
MVTADCLLVEKIKRGDESAFEKIMERFQPRVYRLAYRITNSAVDAEDVTQNVFLILHNKIASFKGESALFSWVYKITLNASWEILRNRKRESHVSIEQYLPQFKEDGRHVEPILDWSNRPDEITTRKEAQVLVRKAIDGLSAEYKTVLILRDIEGLPSKETAEILDLTVPAVKSRLRRARLCIKGRLAGYFSRN